MNRCFMNKNIKKFDFDFKKSYFFYNYEKINFNKRIRNRTNTNYELNEWYYHESDSSLEIMPTKDNIVFQSKDDIKKFLIWKKQSIKFNHKQAIVVDFEHQIEKGADFKFGLIHKFDLNEERDFNTKILQFNFDGKNFILENSNFNSDVTLPGNFNQFYFFVDNEKLDLHIFLKNKNWKVFSLSYTYFNEANFFIEFNGKGSKVKINNIFHDNYIEKRDELKIIN